MLEQYAQLWRAGAFFHRAPRERLKPFFSYFGSKHRLAPRYPPPRPHDQIVEPFAGSAAYATLHADRPVTLVDRDPIIAGLWRYLIAARPREILALPLLEPDQLVSDLSICQEARWLIGFWCNKGSAHPCQRITTSWGTRYPNQFWHEAMRARVASQVDRIRHWRVFEGSYEDAPITHATTAFVDPPYIGRSRISKQRGGAPASLRPVGDRYRFNTKQIDYPALGRWCRDLPGQVIVCEHVGASWLPFVPFATARGNGQRETAEAIWCSVP